MEQGKREIIYLSLHCHHLKDSCIKMCSDESHFNVLLTVRDKVTRQCAQTTTFEEKGEPKRIQTEVPLLTSLTPYRQAKPAHNAWPSPLQPSLYAAFSSAIQFLQCELCHATVLLSKYVHCSQVYLMSTTKQNRITEDKFRGLFTQMSSRTATANTAKTCGKSNYENPGLCSQTLKYAQCISQF